MHYQVFYDVPASELENRRDALRKEMLKNNIKSLVFRSGGEIPSSYEDQAIYRADRNFFYLTGVNRPRTTLVAHAEDEWDLYIGSNQRNAELWEGPLWIPPEHTVQAIVFVREQEAPVDVSSVYTDGRPVEEKVKTEILSRLRLIKSNWEMTQLRKAVQLTRRAHREAFFKILSEDVSERELRGWFDLWKSGYGHIARDIEGMSKEEFSRAVIDYSYQPIVTFGENTRYLHYPLNEDFSLKKSCSPSLALIDVGYSWNGYCADITSTILGDINDSNEKTVQGIVQDALEELVHGLAMDVSQSLTLEDIEDCTHNYLYDRLIKAGVLNSEFIKSNSLSQEEVMEIILPHRVSHWVGLDVHDPGPTFRTDPYYVPQNNQMFTLEPAVYLFDENLVNPEFLGIGAREEAVLEKTEGHIRRVF
jgi:Xaa-Pro aminopeptidase